VVVNVQASFYPNLTEEYECPTVNLAAKYAFPDLAALQPDHRLDRCQDALDYTVGLSFPSRS